MPRIIVLTEQEYESVVCGLFKLRKSIKDRIKCNTRMRNLDDVPKIGMGGGKNVVRVAHAKRHHKKQNEKRLNEIEQLIDRII